jgi:transposase InsO family protein
MLSSWCFTTRTRSFAARLAGFITSQPNGGGSRRCRDWFPVASGRGVSSYPATLLAWHRRLVACKWDYRTCRCCAHRGGIRVVASPPQAPEANAICERFIGVLRREVLDRRLIVNEHHLRQVLTEYLRHYNTARSDRALGQLTPARADSQPPEPVNLAEHRICRKQVPCGLIHEYHGRRVTARRTPRTAIRGSTPPAKRMANS